MNIHVSVIFSISYPQVLLTMGAIASNMPCKGRAYHL
jgi:hypothetical protein